MGGSVPGEPGQEAARCVADIEQADFVAIRLDTSDGEVSAVSGHDPIELADFYSNCARRLRRSASCDGALPVRLGICCAHWKSDFGVWELRSHEIGLWPGSALDMSAEIQRVRHHLASRCAVMADQKTTAEGGDRKDLGSSRQGAKHAACSRWAGQLAYSARWVLSALHAKRAPVIIHDGLSDLLHLHDKFVGEPPQGHLEFGRSWMELFPVVIDTRLMAQEDEAQLLQSPELSRERLMFSGKIEEVHKQLWSLPHGRSAPGRFKELGLYTHRASSGRNGLVAGAGEGSTARGAMEVAEVFLLLMQRRLHCTEAGQVVAQVVPEPKRRKVESCESPGRRNGTSSLPTATFSSEPKLASDGESSARPAISADADVSMIGPNSPESVLAAIAGTIAGEPGSGSGNVGSGELRTEDCSDDVKVKISVPKVVSEPITPPKVSRGATKLPKPACAALPPKLAASILCDGDAPGGPEVQRKRPRSPLDEAALCAATVAALAARLAGTQPALSMGATAACPGFLSSGQASCLHRLTTSSDLLVKSQQTCQLFQNRVAAPGTPPGYLRLDVLLQVKIIKRLRRHQGLAKVPVIAVQEPANAFKVKE